MICASRGILEWINRTAIIGGQVPRRAARIDANQPGIVALIRKLGGSFQHTHQIPGALDGIVGYAGIDQRIEIKDGSKPPGTRKLTPMEEETFREWKGRTPVVIETEQDAIDLITRLRNEGL